MRYRTALLTVGVALLIATAGCAQVLGGANASPNAQTAADSAKNIEVGASGSATAEPNQAIVRVGVVATDDDVAAARQQLTENVSQMQNALAEVGINSSQISTEHYDIRQERRPPRENAEADTTYRAIHSFRITLTNLDRTGMVIDTAVSNGANRVEGVQFAITQQKRQELRQQALKNAMENAREKADTLGSAASLQVTNVERIRTGQTHYRGYEAAMTTAAAGDGGTDIVSGTITVNVQVNVAYNATAT